MGLGIQQRIGGAFVNVGALSPILFLVFASNLATFPIPEKSSGGVIIL